MQVNHLPFKLPDSSSFDIGKAYRINISTEGKPMTPEETSGYLVYRDINGVDACLPFRLQYTGMNAELHACMDLNKLTNLVIDYINIAIEELAITEGFKTPLNIVVHTVKGSPTEAVTKIKYH